MKNCAQCSEKLKFYAKKMTKGLHIRKKNSIFAGFFVGTGSLIKRKQYEKHTIQNLFIPK